MVSISDKITNNKCNINTLNSKIQMPHGHPKNSAFQGHTNILSSFKFVSRIDLYSDRTGHKCPMLSKSLSVSPLFSLNFPALVPANILTISIILLVASVFTTSVVPYFYI